MKKSSSILAYINCERLNPEDELDWFPTRKLSDNVEGRIKEIKI